MFKLVVVLAGVASISAQAVECPATLIGHAYLPANTPIDPPTDAPVAMQVSGRFTGPSNKRIEKLYSIDQDSGYNLPQEGQPIQGFSGIKTITDEDGEATGQFWIMIDNGFGTKANSADVMLMALIVSPDFETNNVTVDKIIFFHDPDRVVPFPLINEHTDMRYLTGADFDVESLQPVGDFLYIGDEFGPFIFKADKEGKLIEFMETPSPFDAEEFVQSSDNPFLRMRANAGQDPSVFSGQRSGGFEGMAQTVDGTKLIPLMEKPLFNITSGELETDADGNPFLRFWEIDIASGEYSSTNMKYRLEGSHAIGDFNMISECCGLIIERDGTQGDPFLSCEALNATEDCFESTAEFKRIYYVDFDAVDEEGFVEKKAYINLLAIEDPENVAVMGTTDGIFTFPFVTIEDVDRVDENTIIVANDNNFPFSIGRAVDTSDNNEFIHLEVADFLNGGANC